MAEENEIIISIKLDQEGAASEMEKVRKSIEDLTAEKRELQKAYKEGNITQQEYIEGAIRIEGTLKEAKKQYSDLTREQETNSNSINALRLSNKRLLEERNNLDLQTEKGKTRLQEINKQLDENNAAIKANVSAYEKQKIGIGDYTGALAKFFPFLGSINEGMEEMKGAFGDASEGAEGANKSMWKLVMNPIGAIIAAVVATLALLYKGLTSTAAGGDMLDDIMASLSAVFQVIMDRVGKLALALVSLFSGDIQGAANNFKDAVSGIGDEMANAAKETRSLAAATRDLEDATIAFEVASAETENTIKRLILQSKNKNLTEKERIDLLNQATKLEKDRVDQEIKNAETALNIANRTAAQRLNIVKNRTETEIEFGKRVLEAFTADNAVAADDLRDKVKEMLIARQEVEGKSLAFQEKIQNQIDANQQKADEAAEKRRQQILAQREKDAQRKQKEAEEELKLIEQISTAKLEAAQKEEEERQAREEKINAQRQALENAMASLQKQFRDKLAAEEVARAQKTADAQLKIENFKNDAINNAGNLFFKKNAALRVAYNAIFKSDALKEIQITTRAAAMKAFDSMAKIPLVGPVLGTAAAAAVIAYGASQAAAILGIPFARGGRVLSGTRINSGHGTPISRSNGDNLLATVRTGEVILNERQQAALGGASTFKRIGVPGFADGGMTGIDTLGASRMARTSIQMDELLRSVTNQRPVLVLEEFEFAAGKKTSADRNAVIV